MFIVAGSAGWDKRAASRRRNVPAAVAMLGLFLCLGGALPAESRPDERPMLRVPWIESKPVIDGMLDEPCWQDAARTGPLKVTRGEPGKSTTEAFVLLDADHLYVALHCAGKLAVKEEDKAGEPAKGAEFADLLIDSNADQNSCYLIRIMPEKGGIVTCSYNEHTPPWHDRTWQPQFEFAAAQGTDAWTAEFALPLDIFCKNKTLASEIGFNVRRSRIPGQEIHCWHGAFDNPGDWGILTGIAARAGLPAPDYAIPKPAPFSSADQWGVTVYRPPSSARRSFLAEEHEQTISLGPGSAHPGTTGEVRLELEEFLLAGDPHAAGIIWDIAVDQRTGELYVLSDPRPVREAPDLRVFDRQGQYLRTIMPLNPTLPRSKVQDLCAKDGTGRGSCAGHPEAFRDPLRLAVPVWRLLAPSAEDGAGARWRSDPVEHLPRDSLEVKD